MTVQELIDELRKHEPDTLVYVFDKNWGPSVVSKVREESVRTTFASWNPDDEKRGLVIR